MSVDTWNQLGTRLVDCMSKISTQSDAWTNDTTRDFTSTEWMNLEQKGDTSYKEAEVSLAEDLESADQMRGARAALQECANDTADHLGLLIQVMEQLANHKLAMDKWKAEHGHHPWFSLTEYKGLEWNNEDRTDEWPNYEYHEYQTIQSAINAENDTIEWETTQVNRLVPQFWAYAQVMSLIQL